MVLKRQPRHAPLVGNEGVMFDVVGDSTCCRVYSRKKLNVSTQISSCAFANRVS